MAGRCPFINPQDPKAGLKVAWNHRYRTGERLSGFGPQMSCAAAVVQRSGPIAFTSPENVSQLRGRKFETRKEVHEWNRLISH